MTEDTAVYQSSRKQSHFALRNGKRVTYEQFTRCAQHTGKERMLLPVSERSKTLIFISFLETIYIFEEKGMLLSVDVQGIK